MTFFSQSNRLDSTVPRPRLTAGHPRERIAAPRDDPGPRRNCQEDTCSSSSPSDDQAEQVRASVGLLHRVRCSREQAHRKEHQRVATPCGEPAGVVQFSYTFEHMSELDESNEKIGGDAATADFGIRSAELFDGPPEDNIGRLIVSNFAEPKAVMNIVSAVAQPGRAAEVTAFGVEMQQVLTSTTGQPAAFVVGISGAFGGSASLWAPTRWRAWRARTRSSKPTPPSPSSWRRPATCSYPGPDSP